MDVSQTGNLKLLWFLFDHFSEKWQKTKQNKTISFKYCFKNEIGRTDCLVKSCCLVSSHNTLSSATFGDEMTQRLRRKLPYNTEKIFKLRHKDKLIKKRKRISMPRAMRKNAVRVKPNEMKGMSFSIFLVWLVSSTTKCFSIQVNFLLLSYLNVALIPVKSFDKRFR